MARLLEVIAGAEIDASHDNKASVIIDSVKHHRGRKALRLGQFEHPNVFNGRMAFARSTGIARGEMLEHVEKLKDVFAPIGLANPIEPGFEKPGNLQVPRL